MTNKDSKSILIGTIDFSDCFTKTNSKELYKKVELGGDLNECSIYVHGGEGKLAHFHISSGINDIDSCPCIFYPVYFDHEGRNRKLDRKQLKKLDELLECFNNKFLANHPEYNGLTRWQTIAYVWRDAGNPLDQWQDPMTYPKPNYKFITNLRKK